jgi:hypothetical protein
MVSVYFEDFNPIKEIDWNMFSELKLVNNEAKIKEKIQKDKNLTRKFNQLIFKNGEYNSDRYNALNSLL